MTGYEDLLAVMEGVIRNTFVANTSVGPFSTGLEVTNETHRPTGHRSGRRASRRYMD